MFSVLALGLTPEDADCLELLPDARHLEFFSAGDEAAVHDPALCHPRRYLADTLGQLRRRKLKTAGVIAFDDYPGSLLAAAIAEALGLPGPGLNASLLCHHKYWSRIVQREVAPAAVPRFQLIDPGRDYRRRELALGFPFWLKPIKTSLSHLGFRIETMDDLARAQTRARAEMPAYAAAFNEMLTMVPRRKGLPRVGGDWLIAEALMKGRQCTLEATMHRGRFALLGIVDSVRFAGRPSFKRFDYPSRLPRAVQARMIAIARKFAEHIGFGDGVLDIEFFVDRSGRPKIIEVNPRFCSQFSDLYLHVDGTSSHDLLVRLATGQAPGFVPRDGRHKAAGAFVLRRFTDAIVRKAPGPRDFARVRALYPEARFLSFAGKGDRLSALAQDAYSFRHGLINLAGDSRAELEEKFRRAAALLPFEFEAILP